MTGWMTGEYDGVKKPWDLFDCTFCFCCFYHFLFLLSASNGGRNIFSKHHQIGFFVTRTLHVVYFMHHRIMRIRTKYNLPSSLLVFHHRKPFPVIIHSSSNICAKRIRKMGLRSWMIFRCDIVTIFVIIIILSHFCFCTVVFGLISIHLQTR